MCLWTKNSIFTEEHASMRADHQLSYKSVVDFSKIFGHLLPIGQMISELPCLVINARMSILHLSVLFILI